MDAVWASELQPITRDRWTELVSAYPAGTSSWEIRRHHIRHHVQVPANVCFNVEHEGRRTTTMMPCSVMNASTGGLMLHSDVTIDPHTAIELQVRLGEEIARLSGWVVHTTGTVNGIKIGTYLHFDETSAATGCERETVAATYAGDRARVITAAAGVTGAAESLDDRRLLARLFDGCRIAFSLEYLFVLGCVAGVSYVIGSMILPAIAR